MEHAGQRSFWLGSTLGSSLFWVVAFFILVMAEKVNEGLRRGIDADWLSSSVLTCFKITRTLYVHNTIVLSHCILSEYYHPCKTPRGSVLRQTLPDKAGGVPS